jgi:hypothetical protein
VCQTEKRLNFSEEQAHPAERDLRSKVVNNKYVENKCFGQERGRAMGSLPERAEEGKGITDNCVILLSI